jgi:hypothetical protein
MRTVLGKFDLELLFLEQHSNQAMNIRGRVKSEPLDLLHFTIPFLLKHLANPAEGCSKNTFDFL